MHREEVCQTAIYLRTRPQLTDKDWEVLEIFSRLLGYYECMIRCLKVMAKFASGSVDGWADMVIFGTLSMASQFLVDKLESYKALAEHFPDPEHFRININFSCQKNC